MIIDLALFTHLLSEAAILYLPELARLLDWSGRIFATFLCSIISLGLSTTPRCLESAVVFGAEWFFESLARTGLKGGPFQPRKGQPGFEYQNVIIAGREA